jgi:hypothetical protein
MIRSILGGGDGRRDRLEVPHLADQDHVGVLPQDVFEGLREGVRVGPDLALIHDAGVVAVQELDRVLDGHDVRVALAVHDVDHRGQRRGLARPGRTGDHHEPARVPCQVGHDRRQVERIDRLDLVRDQPEGGPDRVALEVHVDPEARLAGKRIRHVELELLLESLAQLLRQDRVDHPLERPGREHRILLEPNELAVEPDRRRSPRRQVQVRGPSLEDDLQQLGDRDPVLLVLLLITHRHFTTLAISSIDVRPARAFSSPSSRSVVIPCSMATTRIASEDARSTVSLSISSVINITS